MATLNYDQLTATTRKHYIPKLVDNIYNSNVLLFRLRNKGPKLDGGTKILQPIIFAENGNGGAYAPTDALAPAATDEITAAEYDWRYYWTGIKIDNAQVLKSQGMNSVVNLLESKVRIAEKTMAKNLCTGLFSAGGSNAIDGLQAAIDDGTNTATYGGIDRTETTGYTGSVWGAQYDANGAVDRALTLKLMQSMFGSCSDVNDEPSVIITTQAIFDKYWSLLTPNQRYSSEETANAGFRNLLFNGVPVVVDKTCTAENMFFINEEYIDFISHQSRNFEVTPFKELEGYDMIQSRVYWMGNLVSSNCRYQGRIVDIGATL
jgi:hypothetical protein